MKYLGNALSLGMLDELEHLPAVTLTVAALDNAAAAKWTAENEWESCVGHADTARLLSSLLAQDVQMRRVSTSLVVGDELLVAQYNGPRLPEGATSLPEGARIRWMLVRVGLPCPT